MDFKVGDRVVSIYEEDDLWVKYGDIGVIESIDMKNSFPYTVRWYTENKRLRFRKRELCLECEFEALNSNEDIPKDIDLSLLLC